MRQQLSNWQQRLGVEPYWYLILGGLLLVTLLFINHLRTGNTPGATAFVIPVLNLPIFWYGIFIVGGIALGGYVVSRLANERAAALFNQQVLPSMQKQDTAVLGLSAELSLKLNRRHITTLGELLFRWGLDPRNLGLKPAEIDVIGQALDETPGVENGWVVNAPWRIWNPDHVWNGLIVCLLFAVIGARLYHVLTPSPSMAAFGIVTPWDYFRNPMQLINVRAGGLGIYGGLAGGALGLFIYTRRQRIPTLAWADLAVVGVALGQVFGRWGNFFNQELYGRPTTLPWAITISEAHRLPGYEAFSQFHPAFLYESLWNLLAFLVLYTLAKRYSARLLTGELTALYLIFYAVGRILLETVRLDSRTLDLFGLNLNMAVATFVSLLVALLMGIWVFVRRSLGARP
ncbi:MAG: prolipoprotein diacylglyceryl transferase [Chloroflexi bacterium]|nr:prolipoprotein diacylglyceryl transferase [Ardenticatenaceae bacterium]NOG36240.1 prolipoprotein diacylglyceryl transferase [Chloroflexota bacterium]